MQRCRLRLVVQRLHDGFSRVKDWAGGTRDYYPTTKWERGSASCIGCQNNPTQCIHNMHTSEKARLIRG